MGRDTVATGQTACPCAQAVQDGDILVAQVGIEHIAVGVRYPQCAYSSRPSQGCAVHTAEVLGLSDPTGHMDKGLLHQTRVGGTR